MKYIAFSIILISVFLYGDIGLVLKACLIFGFLSYFPLSHFKRNDKNYFYLLLLLVPSIALFISSFRFKESLTIKAALVWTGVVIFGSLLRFLYESIRIRPIFKRALLMSFTMLLIIPVFRKLGEGNYAVLALLSYLIAGFITFQSQSINSYISLVLLFGPYFFVHLIDAVLSDSMPGLLLILPIFTFSLILVVLIFYTNKLVITKRLTLLLLGVIIFPLIWISQENYSNWLYTRNNRPIMKNHIQFTTSNDKQLMESSSKKISVFLFTSAYCGNCRKEYPYFSDLAKKYSSSDEIGFYCTFLCFKEIDTVYYNKLIQQDFEFKWSMAHESDKVFINLGVDGVPALLILDSEDNVLYNGHCYIRPWIFINSPEIVLKKFLKNKY